MLYARQSLVTHAKAFGLDAIDLVDIDYKGTRDQSTVIKEFIKEFIKKVLYSYLSVQKP